MIDDTTKAEILRLYRQDAWPIGTIARELKLHYSSVERIVREPVEMRARQVRSTIFDDHLSFIKQSLVRWPDIRARRLFDMCVERGFSGSPSHFRSLIRRLRPAKDKAPEAFLRLSVTPGEQGQVDWGHFGHVVVGRARRQLLAFVLVLSWSRMSFVRFFLGGAMPSFLLGHADALEFFGGTPRTLLYDNLKSAVLERRGSAIHFHPTMLELSSHYGFEPRPVGVAKGNEKGRVERTIRFLRDSFFAARQWSTVDDLNAQVREWCLGRAAERPWPGDKTRTVADAFEEERSKLRALPHDRFICDDVRPVQIQKTPYARYDGNDYTVPPEYVRRTLQVVASEKEVRILDGMDVVATPERSYDKGEQIEQAGHLEAIRKEKAKASSNAPNDRLRRAAPQSNALIEELAARGFNIGSNVAHLVRLLDAFEADRLNGAIQTALERGTPSSSSVQMILEAGEREETRRPPVDVDLPDDPRVRDASVKPHPLAGYDFRNEPNDDRDGGEGEDCDTRSDGDASDRNGADSDTSSGTDAGSETEAGDDR